MRTNTSPVRPSLVELKHPTWSPGTSRVRVSLQRASQCVGLLPTDTSSGVRLPRLLTTSGGRVARARFCHPRDPNPKGSRVPTEVQVLAAKFRDPDAGPQGLPRLRVRTRAGRWAVLHASRIATPASDAIAVIIEEPSPAELAPVLMMAYGLTRQEQSVTALACRGLSTKEITARLHITPNTVQDHLKSIFDKTGVSSRRELVATILQEQYLPRAIARQPLGPSGFFTS